MAVYQALVEHHSDDKQKQSDAQIKYGQVEAKVMADERALRILREMSLDDPLFYQPIKE